MRDAWVIVVLRIVDSLILVIDDLGGDRWRELELEAISTLTNLRPKWRL